MTRRRVLTDEQVEEIRERLGREGWTYDALAVHYGVGYSTIWRCTKGLGPYTYKERK